MVSQAGHQMHRQHHRSRDKETRNFFGENGDNRAKKTQCRQARGADHRIWTCQAFKQKGIAEKWEIAKCCKLCFRCLAGGLSGKTCPRSRQCGLNGCKELHHRLLHRPSETEPKSTDQNRTDNQASGTQGTSGSEGNKNLEQTTMTASNVSTADFIALRTVPVVLKNGDRSLKVNALLDDASTKTYINLDVAAHLGLQGKTERVTVNVLNGQVETFETRPVYVELGSLTGDVKLGVTAYTATRVVGTMTAFDWTECTQRWSHLRHISFPSIAKRPVVNVLIGLDCTDLHCAIQEVRGRPREPIARLTPLGWTCIGNPRSDETFKTTMQTHFASTYIIKDRAEIEQLNTKLKRFWEIDDMSVLRTGTMGDKPIVRIEEQSALKKAEQSIQFADGMYRVGVPWRGNEPKLPVNYKMALKRLENTEKKLVRSPAIATPYCATINQYIDKGYIKKVGDQNRNKSKWLLPHFPVIKPDKETTKTRIVFDASVKCIGVSLNDVINQGQKLQQDMFDALLRFRRYPVAVVCDIVEMYLRIGIALEDKQYHRFLWRGIEQDRSPEVYEFDRVVFGSPPFLAPFVLQHHAKKHQSDYDRAAETILKATDMDDSMDCVQDEKQGIRLYRQLSCLLSKAGMHARKWLSNSPTVLSEVPIQDRKSEVDLDRDQLPCAKTLGVWWLAKEDIFIFRDHVPESHMQYTKCNFLKKIATLFDPIGFLAPFTIRAKMLLQDMWTAGLGWDNELTEPLINLARAWFSELGDLKDIQVPRRLWNEGMISDSMSLHTFVDVSESAYGAVVYARCTYENGTVSTYIVAARTRVSLNIGVRLASRIAEVLWIKLIETTFW